MLAIFQGLSISRPIKQLAWKADQIARGDLDARVEVTVGDEIGLLGENFNFMADQIAILLQQTAEKARIEQELEVAQGDPGDAGAERRAGRQKARSKFAGFYQPAAQTGGDWWTWAELVGGKILVVIGDVTGHGVPSAMITAAAKAACDVARYVHDDDVTVTRLLEIMNHAIFESAQRRFVMTCFASIVDTKARTITYANAGHNFPYLFRTGEGKGEFGSLMIRGNRLGDDRDVEVRGQDDRPACPATCWSGTRTASSSARTRPARSTARSGSARRVRKAAALDAGEMRDAIIADAATYFGDTAAQGRHHDGRREDPLRAALAGDWRRIVIDRAVRARRGRGRPPRRRQVLRGRRLEEGRRRVRPRDRQGTRPGPAPRRTASAPRSSSSSRTTRAASTSSRRPRRATRTRPRSSSRKR